MSLDSSCRFEKNLADLPSAGAYIACVLTATSVINKEQTISPLLRFFNSLVVMPVLMSLLVMSQ